MESAPVLTAADIHALYFGPYTAPDGSGRRGLFERVGDARPRFDDGDLLAWNGDDFAWAEDLHQLVVPPGVAIALCRVGVEDWPTTGEHNYSMDVSRNLGAPEERRWSVTFYGGKDEAAPAMGWGPTRDHALVAAGHAVADAMGVAP